MNKFLAIAVLMVLSVVPGLAHSVTVAWTAGTVTGENYHLWRAPCSVAISAGICPTASEGTFAIVGATSAATFTDSSVVGNTNYSYYVTAFCAPPSVGGTCPANYATNLDSAPSNHIGAAIPGDPLPAVGGLTITTTTQNFADGNETLTASWYKQGAVTTTYTLKSSTGVTLAQDKLASTDGRYVFLWTGPRQVLTLRVCDPQNNCASKTIS